MSNKKQVAFKYEQADGSYVLIDIMQGFVVPFSEETNYHIACTWPWQNVNQEDCTKLFELAKKSDPLHAWSEAKEDVNDGNIHTD